jgi:hypothetical protein
MSTQEIFSSERMTKCVALQRLILDSSRKSNRFEMIVRATDSVHGVPFHEMRRRHFSVGISGNMTELPFHDLLVVITLIAKEIESQKTVVTSEKTASFRVEFSEDFSDEEAMELLAYVTVETPFDDGRHLQLQRVERHASEV